MAASGKGAVGKEVFDRAAFGRVRSEESSLSTRSTSLTKSPLPQATLPTEVRPSFQPEDSSLLTRSTFLTKSFLPQAISPARVRPTSVRDEMAAFRSAGDFRWSQGGRWQGGL
jgi:hypothetical protein